MLLRSEQVRQFLREAALPFSHRFVQLVGTALLVFVKAELTAVIRNVEGTSRKVVLPSPIARTFPYHVS